jgi:hypothetical protein
MHNFIVAMQYSCALMGYSISFIIHGTLLQDTNAIMYTGFNHLTQKMI